MPVLHAHILAAALALGGAAPSEEAESLACLALNVYHEARGESPAGQAAVAFVTLNRVRSAAFPDTVCAVVSQRRGGVCQFSWVCDAPKVGNKTAFARALRVALDVLQGRRDDPSKGAQFFVARTIATPDWARRMRLSAEIGAHRFFRKG